MEHISTVYRQEEQAWCSEVISLHRDIYLIITLSKAGKVVIRQNSDEDDGEWLRVPIKRHKDTSQFCFRMRASSPSMKIRIFTSTQPKEIKYDYI